MFLSVENKGNEDENDLFPIDECGIRSIPECIFCNVKLTSKNEFKHSKLLQCLHAICNSCYINWDYGIEKQCSICSFYSKKTDVMENKVLAEMVSDDGNSDSKDVCTIHGVPVTHWCIDCQEFICGDCVNHHGQLKSTQNHVIKSLKEYLKHKANRSVFTCILHPQNDLTIVCNTCKLMTCRDCQLDGHKNHKYDFICDKAASAKTELFDIYKKVEYKSVVLKSAIKNISEQAENLERVKHSLVSDIQKEFDLIQELLKIRCKSLMLTAIGKTNKKIEDCEINRRVIKQNVDLLQHCLKFVKFVLYTSSDAAVFYTKDLILNYLKCINLTQSIPNSLDIINLKFTSENIDEVTKKIEICGAMYENENIALVDNYCSTVNSKNTSAHKTRNDLKQQKNKTNLSDVLQSTSSAGTENALPPISIIQLALDGVMASTNEINNQESYLPENEQVSTADNRNESWCSVCLLGGEVVCCDYCTKAFHKNCHIPQITVPCQNNLFPINWQCLLCQDIQPLHRDSFLTRSEKLLKEMEIASRLLLELYCQVDANTPFKLPVNSQYQAHRTACLTEIKYNLASGKYKDISSFVKDVRYVFDSCFHYEHKDYMKISHARSLLEIFNRLLTQFIPCDKRKLTF